jgi:exonuclease SbcC
MLESVTQRQADLRTQGHAFGEISFAPEALTCARADLDRSRAAATRVQEYDVQLARRSEHEAAISSSSEDLAQATQLHDAVQVRLDATPFDDLELEQANDLVERAQQEERRLQARRESERREALRIGHQIDQVAEDEKRVANVAKRADEARVQADVLDRMYTEFNRFEQYVARRVRPQLEDLTSELVRTITEGKYDGVRLDDDYGITVEDGEMGYFPISEFSGGERDVISLSARLALSRLIGAQAANPPSFLVLDEVFGSLDRERRSNVLELLGNLAGSAEAFRQLFVISHVDDVRLSPAFGEVWRVSENADGFSSLENLTRSQGLEDI